MDSNLFSIGLGALGSPLNVIINYKMLAIIVAVIGLCVLVVTWKTDDVLRHRANLLITVGIVLFFAPILNFFFGHVSYALLLEYGWINLPDDYNTSPPNHLFSWLRFPSQILGFGLFGLGWILTIVSVVLARTRQPRLA